MYKRQVGGDAALQDARGGEAGLGQTVLGGAGPAAGLADEHRGAVQAGGISAYAEAGGEVVRSGNRWSMDRQVRMTAGSIALVGAVASQVGSKRFGLIPAAIGAGLSFSAVSNTCAMASVLAKMPWNRPAQERSAGDVIGRIPTGAGKRS